MVLSEVLSEVEVLAEGWPGRARLADGRGWGNGLPLLRLIALVGTRGEGRGRVSAGGGVRGGSASGFGPGSGARGAPGKRHM
jgi:hypothetical protein